MQSRIFLLFLVFISSFLFSQDEEQISPGILDSISVVEDMNTIKIDSLLRTNYTTENTLYPKKLADNFTKKYQSKEFDYSTIKPQESLWTRIKRKFEKIWESIFGNAPNAVGGVELFLKILAILIVAAALFFIIRYLLGKDGNFFFSRKDKVININSSVLHENIHEINFPNSIAEFENKREFRSAIRYQFLFILKKMTDQKLIHWNPEKTNTDYIAEIASENNRDSYQKLSYIFENVWYGEQKIDEDLYQKFKEDFLNSSLSKNKIL
ncbi:DUF4129 domain-containing protein [Frigoriflavimonas asaccharolytica]|nr:DUF4129 domain-containing protein [Frigoriflavimonas asaccharolytica]